MELRKRGEFIVASGEGIPDYGRVRLKTVDEYDTERKISGSVTEVHKPLGSAAEMSATHDALIWDNGGSLIPKWSPIAIGLRRAYEKLCWKYGADGVLPLYREGNLYNFYLAKTAAPVQLNPVEGEIEMAPGDAKSGNSRQVKRP